MRPAWASTIRLAMKSPKPEAAPIVVLDLREALEHQLNLVGRNPGALVADRTLQLAAARSPRSVMRLPRGLNLMELAIRLPNT
jgi:hypothetical protein